MILARQFAAAVTALSLVAGAAVVFLFSVVDSRAEAPFGSCEDAAELAVLPSPVAPWKGAPLRVIFAAEKPLEGELSLIAPDGKVAAASRERHGGPPYFWFAEVAAPAAGTWHAKLARDNAPAECSAIMRDIAVRAQEPPRPRETPGSIWPIRDAWTRSTENLYSAWIEKLFDAPLDAAPSWKALHEVLRDRSRNFLYNHLGLREDQMGMIVRPDCADLPYFLRAYFAFKMGLPFGYSKCSRGDGGEAPKCPEWWNIQNPEPPRLSPAEQQKIASVGLFGMLRQPVPAIVPAASAEAAGACAGVRPLFAGPRRRRPFRVGADGGERRPHRLLSRAADRRRAAPRDRVRGPVWACVDDCAARAAVGRRGGRHLRRRRPARRHGRAKALLARQFPVRTGSRAGEPRVQALPADRARQERHLAAPDQRGHREKSAIRRLFARSVEARDRRLLRSDGRRDVAATARSLARDERGDHVARRANEGARDLGRKRAEVPEQRARRGRDAGRRDDLRDHRRVGRLRDAGARFAPVDRDRRGARDFPIASRGGPSGMRCRSRRASPT